jgi:hypothetical protein
VLSGCLTSTWWAQQSWVESDFSFPRRVPRTMQSCIQIRTAKLYPELITKELALFGILWGSLPSCAPMVSALFESRKCPILGMGLLGKMDFSAMEVD